jgi:outer membrane protein insertion porin family
LIQIKAGDTFSRRLVTASSTNIGDRLGTEGYAFSNINPVPELDKEKREVSLTFMVDPGRRVYVRRMNIYGNTRTKDEVVRREFRQMENGWIGTDKVNRSRVRLQRLGFFEDVNVETPAVPGVEDQVDVNFSLTERSAGSLQAGLGFSQSQGVLFTASISHNNFMGSGKRVSAEINTSDVNTIYSFSYTNPYYTLDGVSRGFQGFFRQTDSGRNTADFNADSFGGAVNYGIPLTEFQRARFGLGAEHTKIKTTDATPQSYLDFLDNNKDEFDALKLNMGWSYDSRNRAIFPDSGGYVALDSEIALPGGEINYYKLGANAQYYQPLTKKFTAFVNTQVAYGDGFDKTTGLPFWEHYYAGGQRSVRGFRSNTLGPEENGNPLGGTFKVVGNAELVFPVPFSADSKSLRLSAFYDTGNVFTDRDAFDTTEFRSAAGISMVWLSPIGPMVFSLAEPVKSKATDDTETFQFSLGTGL